MAEVLSILNVMAKELDPTEQALTAASGETYVVISDQEMKEIWEEMSAQSVNLQRLMLKLERIRARSQKK